MDDVLDVEDIITNLQSPLPTCRVCLGFCVKYNDFEATLCFVYGQEITFSEGFYELCPDEKYLHYENMPKYFCRTCGKDLLNAYLFIKRLQRSNDTLNKIKNITKESPSKFVTNNLNIDKEEIQDVEELFPILESQILPDKCASNILDTNDSIKLENQEEEEECDFEEESMESENTLIEPKMEINIEETDRSELDWNVTDDKTTVQVGNESGFLSETEEGLEDKYKNSEHENVKIEHDPEHEENKDYNCNICSFPFDTKTSLNIHNARTHKITKTDEENEQEDIKSEDCQQIVPSCFMKIHCSLCEKTFPTKLALKHHSNTKSCRLCGQCYSRPSALKRHIKLLHKVENNKYECKECGLFFKYPWILKEHSRKHDKSIQFPCTHCDRRFLQKKNLEHHTMRFHLNEFPFKCDSCDKCYATKCNLYEHIRSKHTNATFDCNECKEQFESQSELREHKYTHDGYPFNCPLCSVGLTSRFKLKQHLMRKHKGALTEDEFNVMFPICK